LIYAGLFQLDWPFQADFRHTSPTYWPIDV
jgi:hypothetical protein